MSRVNVLTVVTFLTVLGASIGLSQGLYLTANAGYSLGSGTQYFGSNTDATQTPASIDGLFGSYGEGFKFGASAGYMFSKNLGAELGLAYWLGNTFEQQSKFTNGSGTIRSSGSGFAAIPSIVLSANIEPVNPYARLGLVLGILKITREYNAQSRSQTEEITQEITQEETGNLAFGYAGAFGFLISAGSSVGFFIEADIHSVTYSPSQSEYTKLTQNGVDQLPLLEDTVYEYKESFHEGDEAVFMAARRPFSSIGIVMGVRVDL